MVILLRSAISYQMMLLVVCSAAERRSRALARYEPGRAGGVERQNRRTVAGGADSSGGMTAAGDWPLPYLHYREPSSPLGSADSTTLSGVGWCYLAICWWRSVSLL